MNHSADAPLPRRAEDDTSVQLLKMMEELLDDSRAGHADGFDPSLLVACRQYLDRHQAARLAADHIKRTTLLSASELRGIGWGASKLHLVLSHPLRTQHGRVFLAIEITVVVVACIAVVLQTLPQYNPQLFPDQAAAWIALDGAVSNFFLIQWIVTFAVHPPPRRRFVLSWRTLLDIITISPFYVQLGISANHTSIIGALDSARILRILRLVSYVSDFQVLLLAMRKSVKLLLAPLVFLAMIVLFLASLVYYAERGDYDSATSVFLQRDCVCESSASYVIGLTSCPRVPSRMHSIPYTMWLIVESVTTVGYGDLVPRCNWGRLWTSLSMIVGPVVLSIPVAVTGTYYGTIFFQKRAVHQSLLRRRGTGSFRDTRITTDDPAQPERPVAARSVPWDTAQGFVAYMRRCGSTIDDGLAAELRCFNLYHPSSAALYFVQLFLDDFCEELLTTGRDAPHSNDVCLLMPMMSGAAASDASHHAGPRPGFFKISTTAAVTSRRELHLHSFERLHDCAQSADVPLRTPRPGVYQCMAVANVRLSMEGGSSSEQAGELLVHISFATQASAENTTYAMEPWSRASAGRSGIDHVPLSKPSYFVSEKQLYPNAVVRIRGTAYQYRHDEADLLPVVTSFDCAIRGLRQRGSHRLLPSLAEDEEEEGRTSVVEDHLRTSLPTHVRSSHTEVAVPFLGPSSARAYKKEMPSRRPFVGFQSW